MSEVYCLLFIVFVENNNVNCYQDFETLKKY